MSSCCFPLWMKSECVPRFQIQNIIELSRVVLWSSWSLLIIHVSKKQQFSGYLLQWRKCSFYCGVESLLKVKSFHPVKNDKIAVTAFLLLDLLLVTLHCSAPISPDSHQQVFSITMVTMNTEIHSTFYQNNFAVAILAIT